MSRITEIAKFALRSDFSLAVQSFLFVVAILSVIGFGLVLLVQGIDWQREFFELGELVGQFKAGMESVE